MPDVPRVMRPESAKTLVREYFDSVRAQFARVEEIDPYARGSQGGDRDESDHVWIPKEGEVSDEYRDLAWRSKSPWGGLITTSLAQTLFLEAMLRIGNDDSIPSWRVWRENGWESRQDALYRAEIEHGVAFVSSMPSKIGFNKKLSVKMRGHSARRMACFYDDENDEWPLFGIRAEPTIDLKTRQSGWNVWLYDETAVHRLTTLADGALKDDWTYIDFVEHPAGVTPIVRYTNRIDLDGKAIGEIEPIIPLLARVDQDAFDRLIVQRFGAWKVRYIAGMTLPESADGQAREKLRLAIENILVAKDAETKFGTLDATDLAGFIASEGADLRTLSAVTQTPPHHLLGLSANMQAESLAAAEAGLMRKSSAFRTSNGESWEQQFRLNALLLGEREDAMTFDLKAKWGDPETRSLAQAAQALGQLATGLKVPVEMLWRRIPGWTDGDSQRAKKLIEDGAVDMLMRELQAQGAFTDKQLAAA